MPLTLVRLLNSILSTLSKRMDGLRKLAAIYRRFFVYRSEFDKSLSVFSLRDITTLNFSSARFLSVSNFNRSFSSLINSSFTIDFSFSIPNVSLLITLSVLSK